MEQMRSNDRFSYTINVDPNVITSDIEIPGMIIQPFIENSIQHGVAAAKEEGYINLTISKNGSLRVKVEDNGPGINAVKNIRTGSEDHESMGMEITMKRIEVYNSLHDEDIHLEVTDKAKTGTNGTVVQLEFPLTHDS
jgi:sensor histidine kinase YesM